MALERDLTEAMLDVVRTRMTEQGLSGRALAQRAGLPTNTLAIHLRGEGIIPLEEWEVLAQALGSNRLEELLTEARKRP